MATRIEGVEEEREERGASDDEGTRWGERQLPASRGIGYGQWFLEGDMQTQKEGAAVRGKPSRLS
jgi:hypothetical protein